MEGQFKEMVNNMYLTDKRELRSLQVAAREQWIIGGDSDDRSEDYYYQRNVRRDIRSISEKIILFNILQRRLQDMNSYTWTCSMTQLSFVRLNCYGWIRRGESFFTRSVITDDTKATHDPFSLQHIAAARSIPTLKYCKPNILIGIYNATKSQDLYIRVGDVKTRKNYKFANIVKHHIYDQSYDKSLVSMAYFENLKLKPTPFCVDCGLIRKIEESLCNCLLCNLAKYALTFTPVVEKPFHTTYRSCHNRCLK